MTESSPSNQSYETKQERKPIGPMVGTAIILVILIIGGLYFWGAKLNQGQNNPPPLILGDDARSQ